MSNRWSLKRRLAQSERMKSVWGNTEGRNKMRTAISKGWKKKSSQPGENDGRTKDFVVCHPDGKKEIVSNLSQFCREEGLNRATMGATVTGRVRDCVGFKARIATNRDLRELRA